MTFALGSGLGSLRLLAGRVCKLIDNQSVGYVLCGYPRQQPHRRMLQWHSTQCSLSRKVSHCWHSTAGDILFEPAGMRKARCSLLHPLSLCRPPRLVANNILCLVLLSLSLNRRTKSSSERRDHRSAQRPSTRLAQRYAPATHNTGLCKNHWRTRRTLCSHWGRTEAYWPPPCLFAT
jgi:hypothetical protein